MTEAMSEPMIYIGKRMLVTGVALEPGRVYEVAPIGRNFGRDGFWVEVSDGRDKCRCPYRSQDEFVCNWEPKQAGMMNGTGA
jgi:hypothetical protein